jgi:predicted regulator of Ras-like GTPase activity (Roadblock/LC7/MglB family)
MTRRPPEAQRDQLESAFTPLLRKLWNATPSMLAAAFVDLEGECIDYVSSIDPFEAKVSAAHALVLMDGLRAARQKLGLREPVLLAISGDARELWARRVSDDYLLVALLIPGAASDEIRGVLAATGREFRNEVGVATPAWEPASSAIEVTVRPAVGWPYAPLAFTRDGVRTAIGDVLGRWVETGAAADDEIVCFRVRTGEGQELTLVHDARSDGWRVRS